MVERSVEACAPGVGVAPEDTLGRSRASLTLIVAIGAVWLFWGSTFAAMRYAVGTIPPFAMAGIRFLIAGAILYAICVARGKARITRADAIRAFVTGGSLLLLGNGMTAWTVQFLPSGLNSLLLSCSPIWMAIIAFLWGGERPTRLAIVGMVLGLVGLGLLAAPHSGGAMPLWPVLVAIFASVAWSFGSIYQRRVGKPRSLVQATALQMLAGGAMLVIEASLTGEWSHLHLQAVSAASLWGLAWLIVFGSLISYSAYLYTMQAASTALASTYAYVNPLVAVALGFVLFGERLTPLEAGASAIIIVGVALMMLPRRSGSAKTA